LAKDGFIGNCRGYGGDFALEQISPAQVQFATRHALWLRFAEPVFTAKYDGFPVAPG
jgi:hypothetical protein